jgi:hypothetical protein
MSEFLLEFDVVRYPVHCQTRLSNPATKWLGWDPGRADLVLLIVLERELD